MMTLDRRRLLTAAVALSAAPLLDRTAFAADAPNQTLTDLLAMVPANVIDAAESTGVAAYYADLAGQAAALGAKKPDVNNKASMTAWIKATSGLAGPSAMAYALSPDWIPTFGFSLFDVDQSLEAGEPPDMVTIYRGAFDANAIGKALIASGYQTVDATGASVWSIAPDGSLDPSKTAIRLTVGRMNNVALIGGRTMIATRKLDLLQEVLATQAGTASPAAAESDLTEVLGATSENLASALLLTGEGIGSSTVKLALTGVTPGSALPLNGPAASGVTEKRAKWEWTLLTGSSSEAAALATSIDAKLKTGKSVRVGRKFSDLFASWKTRAAGSIVTLEIEFSSTTVGNLWTQMIYARDVAFLAGG